MTSGKRQSGVYSGIGGGGKDGGDYGGDGHRRRTDVETEVTARYT